MYPRRFLMLLTGFAMLFAPLAMESGAAMAMSPGDHYAQMSQSGHCDKDDQSADGDSNKAGMACCVATCAAVSVVPTASIDPAEFTDAEPSVPDDQFRRSFLAELPTPPPRLS